MAIQATTFYTVAAAIFITNNLILGQKTNTNQETAISEPEGQSIVSTPSSDDLKIDPLPSSIFKKPLTDFLSPDLFSKANPLDYFLTIASKLSEDRIRKTYFDLKYNISNSKFPQPYIPYAELLSSLLPHLISLRLVKSSIVGIQITGRFVHPPLMFSENPSPDPQFLTLFSSDIFLDKKPPAVILYRLLDIPQTNIPSLLNWLQKLSYSHTHNDSIVRYYWYIKCILIYFNYYGKTNLQTLRYLAEKHRGISTLNSSDSGQYDQQGSSDDVQSATTE